MILKLTLNTGAKIYIPADKVAAFYSPKADGKETVIVLEGRESYFDVRESLDVVYEQFTKASILARTPSGLAVAGDILAGLDRKGMNQHEAAREALNQALVLLNEYKQSTE